MAKIQYKIMIEEELANKLTRLAAECGYSSGNGFAAAALDEYSDLLAELLANLNKRTRVFRDEQVERVLEELLGKAPAATRQ